MSPKAQASALSHVQYLAKASAEAEAWAEAKAFSNALAEADAYAQPLALPPLLVLDTHCAAVFAVAWMHSDGHAVRVCAKHTVLARGASANCRVCPAASFVG